MLRRRRRRASRRLFLAALFAPLLALALTGVSAAAQSSPVDEWRWVRFGVAEGLPSPVIDAIGRAKDGTIWVSTEQGPAWYDGYRWQLVADSAGHLLQGGRSGPIIVAEDGAVLIRYGPDIWRVARRGAPARLVPRPATGAVWFSVAVAKGGELWGAFVLNGVLRLARRIGGAWHEERWPGRRPMQMYDLQLQQGPDETVLLSVGLETWSRRDGAWVSEPPFNGGAGAISRITWNAAGEVRLVVRTSGARQGVWARGPHTGPRWQRLAEFGHDAPAAIAIGPKDEGLVVLDAGDVMFAELSGWRRLQLPSYAVPTTGVMFDGSGDVWFATRDGMVLWRRTSGRRAQWRLPAPAPANRVNGLAVSDDGRLAAATAGGVALLDPKGVLQVVFSPKGVVFTTVAWGRSGEMWAGSGGSVPGVFHRTANGWRHRTDAPGLDQAGIHRIVRDRDGSCWLLGIPFGQHGRGGVWRESAGRIDAVTLPPSVAGGRFYDMVQDSIGQRWFATNRGVLRDSAGTFVLVPPARDQAGDVAFSLAIADSGALWVSVRPSGVLRVLPGLRAELPDTSGAAPTGQVTVYRAGDGRIWASNADGIWLRVGDGWTRLSRALGLPTLNVWPLVTSGSDLYVGTMGAGVLRVRLDELAAARPRVIPLPSRAEGGELKLRWSVATERGTFAPVDLESRWRLDDEEWSAWSAATEITAPAHVPWRRHVLWVEARTPLGVTSQAPARLAFEVPAPVWWRRDVLTVVSALLVLLAWLSVLLVRRRRLQEQMSRRIREAERMELVGTFAAGMAHELNNLLTTITVNAELVEDAPGSESPSPSAEIHRAALLAAAQLRHVLSFTSDLSRVVSVIDLAALLRAQQEPIGARVREHIEMRWHLPNDAVPVLAEPNAMAAVLRSLVEHACDHLHGTGLIEVTLRVRQLDAPQRARLDLAAAPLHAEIEITDSSGRAAGAEARRTLEAGFPSRDNPVASLALVHGLVRRLGGAVHADDADGRGRVLRVYLPVAVR